MRVYPIIFSIASILCACDTSYDGVTRDPALKAFETKMISDLECEDAVITSRYDSIGAIKGQSLRLIFINSKKVKLNDSDEVKDEWCYSISDKFVDNFVEENHPYQFIEIEFVERSGLVFSVKKYYANKYLISTFKNDTVSSAEKM